MNRHHPTNPIDGESWITEWKAAHRKRKIQENHPSEETRHNENERKNEAPGASHKRRKSPSRNMPNEMNETKKYTRGIMRMNELRRNIIIMRMIHINDNGSERFPIRHQQLCTDPYRPHRDQVRRTMRRAVPIDECEDDDEDRRTNERTKCDGGRTQTQKRERTATNDMPIAERESPWRASEEKMPEKGECEKGWEKDKGVANRWWNGMECYWKWIE